MAAFNPSMIVPAAKSAEFAGAGENERNAKSILLDGITKQIALFKSPNENGRRWFTVGKTETKLTLRVNNQPIKIVGDETSMVVPSEHFEAAMNHYAKEIKDGKLDAALEIADKGIATRREKLRATREEKKKAQ
jgi:hypothetical protein